MTIGAEQWKEILGAINEQEDLNQDNVIEKIKDELRETYPEEYEKWGETGEADFDIDHLFEVEVEGQVLRCELLFVAVQCEYAKVLKVLIKNGANIDIKGMEGFSILHHAAAAKYIDLVKTLIARGDINVNEKSKQMRGYTPLHCAAKVECMEIVRLLIEEGRADPSLKDDAGETPRDLAIDNSIKDFLRNKEEEALKNLGKTNDLPRHNTNNKDIPHLLERTKETQPTSVTTEMPIAGSSTDAVHDPTKETQPTSVTTEMPIAGSSTDAVHDPTKETQPTSAIAKGIFAGGAVAVLGAAIAVALFATGTVAVELMPIMIAVAIVTTAALAVGGITYMMSQPSTRMDETKGPQNVNGNVLGGGKAAT